MGEAGAERYGEALLYLDIRRLEIFGDEYISQHILDYLKRDTQRQILENYIAEGIRMIAENTARNGGRYLTAKYIELITPRTEPEETAEQIISRMRGRIKKLSKKGG